MSGDLVVVSSADLRELILSAVSDALAVREARKSYDERSAARYLGIGRSTLGALRQAGSGPAYGVRGGRIVYDKRDLDAYCEATRVTPVAAPRETRRRRA